MHLTAPGAAFLRRAGRGAAQKQASAHTRPPTRSRASNTTTS
jgi:hypothetical protein